MYNLDGSGGAEDCPKCKHSLQRLSAYNSIKKNEGYSIDDGTGNSNFIGGFLFGWIGVIGQILIRNVFAPMWKKASGEKQQSKYADILKVYPNSQICPYCKHVLRRK